MKIPSNDKRARAKLLSPNQRTSLLVAPRLHMAMLLSGAVDAEYFDSLAGALNIANALAAKRQRGDLVATFDAALGELQQLIAEQRAPDPEQGKTIRHAFNAADQIISLTSREDLARAVAYVDRRIASQRATAAQGRKDESA